jgi:hypothetical protein
MIEQVEVAVILLINIRTVLDSNLGGDTGFSD